MNRIFFCSFVILVLCQSCYKVGPEFQEIYSPCKHQWIDSEIQTTDDFICYWWQTFDDATLNNLIEIAYSQNLPLQIACYRIQEARARLGVVTGEFYPQVQEGFGSVSWTQISKHQPNTGIAPDLHFKDYQLGLQAAWELDFWGKFRRAIESENATLCASFASYDDVLVLLLSDVASVYVQIRVADEQIEIVRRNIAIQNRSLEIAKAQFRGGFVSELDVQQATTLLKDTEARLPDLEAQRRIATNALCVLLGIAPQEIGCLLGDEGQIPIAPEKVIVNMPEELLCRRPDIRQAYFEAAAQSARIGVAYADFFPQVSLTGLIAFRSGDSALNFNGRGGSLFDRDSLTFDYGASFAWPLLNYGRITNSVEIEKMRYCQLMKNYQDVVLRAYQEVEDGLISFLKTNEQAALLSDSVVAAKRSVDLSKTQYVEGMVDYTRVLNTQQALLSEEERWTLARGNIALSLIATYKALGGGWEIKYAECE